MRFCNRKTDFDSGAVSSTQGMIKWRLDVKYCHVAISKITWNRSCRPASLRIRGIFTQRLTQGEQHDATLSQHVTGHHYQYITINKVCWSPVIGATKIGLYSPKDCIMQSAQCMQWLTVIVVVSSTPSRSVTCFFAFSSCSRRGHVTIMPIAVVTRDVLASQYLSATQRQTDRVARRAHKHGSTPRAAGREGRPVRRCRQHGAKQTASSRPYDPSDSLTGMHQLGLSRGLVLRPGYSKILKSWA